MRLQKLGPDGEPVGEPFVVGDGPSVIGWCAPEVAGPAETVETWAPQSVSFRAEVSEEQFYGWLEFLGYATLAQELREQRAALAVWEGEGGWCG